MKIFAVKQAIVILVLCWAAVLQAGQQSITLREQLGLLWTNELVSYPFSAPPGACADGSITLTGPGGDMPAQLSHIEYWPGGDHIRSARLWFLIPELQPLTTHEYKVQYGARTAPAASLPPADLRVSEESGEVELGTTTFGIRLLLGEHHYKEPVPASDVPGPVRALRPTGGPWFGGSRMYGQRRISGYQAAIEESGPIFTRVGIRYIYEGGMTMDLSVRLVSGDLKASWSMSVQPKGGVPAATGSKSSDEEDEGNKPDGWRELGEGSSESPNDGWHLLLSPGLESLVAVLGPEHHDYKWGKREFTNGEWSFVPGDVTLQQEPVGKITTLVPWEDWWDSFTQAQWTFKAAGRGEVFRVAATHPEVWMEPATPGTWGSWGSPKMRAKWIPLMHDKEGTIYMEINAAAGERRWDIGSAGQSRPDSVRLSWQAAPSVSMPGAQVGVGGRLNQVKDYVLTWPEAPEPSHPHLYASREDIQAAQARGPAAPEEVAALRKRARTSWAGRPHTSDADALAAYIMTGSREVARETKVVERLTHHLNMLGNYDLMRNISTVAALYDGVIDSGLLSAEERPLARARMAYLGYLMADPATWSIERGYCSGNLNMSISYILNLGLIASLLPEHPSAQTWAQPAVMMFDQWMEEKVGPAGEWPESVSNYAHVSASWLLNFAVAAMNAGLHDFINDPRMKRLMLYLTKQYTPLDPRFGGERKPGLSLLPGSGRSGAGKAWALPGIMARATLDSDPDYSSAMQWSWLRNGASHFTGAGSRLAGFVQTYVNPTLPARRPDWGSELFPQVSAILRHGLGTKDEWYVNFMVPTYDTDYWPSEHGAFAAIFARGVPIAARFAGGYAEREELFMSRVLLARDRGTDKERRERFFHAGDRKMADFSALPRQDYLEAEFTIEQPRYRSNENGAHDHMEPVPEWPAPIGTATGPVRWRRQLLFAKGDRPADAGYLLLRDTVRGGQPTMWQMWTVSEKIGTPEQVRNRANFLADKPGDRPVAARTLTGDRFTAAGPFGVDTEFYIASPERTPRSTLRWGTTYDYSPIDGFSEYMDLLHVQMPGDGAYYVAMFPRRQDEPVPTFETLAGGAIIRVQGEFGTDYGFLSGSETTAAAEGARFRGTAGSVQDRKDGLVLALGAKGEVRCREFGISAGSAASLRVAPDVLSVEMPAASAAVQIAITAPGEWTVGGTPAGVTLARENGALAITLGAGVTRVTLVAAKTEARR